MPNGETQLNKECVFGWRWGDDAVKCLLPKTWYPVKLICRAHMRNWDMAAWTYTHSTDPWPTSQPVEQWETLFQNNQGEWDEKTTLEVDLWLPPVYTSIGINIGACTCQMHMKN